MHIQSAPSVVPRHPSFARQALLAPRLGAPAACLAVGTVGYLVPRGNFTGRVHSVFAQACNIAVGDTLVTLSARRAGNGPTTWRLAGRTACDLRDLRELFEAGERVVCRDGAARTGRVLLRLAGAAVWRPDEPRALLAHAQIDAHLRAARVRLAQRRRTCSSVIDGRAAPVMAALRDACRTLDSDAASRAGERLIGWGEGLTPAGDDVLVGLLAGLDAFAPGDARRLRFRAALASAVVAGLQRTTPIAAHYLRLAAGGHYSEPLVDLRNALVCEPDWQAVDMCLQRALDVGATSGADTVSGLLAALSAWCPAGSTAMGA
jgi:Protein of unknown function (DUF2877)